MKIPLTPRSFRLLSVVLISSWGWIVYSNSLHCSFHFDDQLLLVQNTAIRDLHDLPGIWHYFHTRFITFLSMAVNYRLNALNVFGYHLFNLGVHLISAILVWWLVRLTLSCPVMKNDRIAQHADIIALFAGLVFVSHPLQTEAITYIWQRAASMAAMFYLASLCFYIKYRLEASKGLKGTYYIISLLSAVAAMFTKENAITLPLMVLFYEFVFLKTKNGLEWPPLFPYLLALFILPITFLFVKSQTFQQYHGVLRYPGGIITPLHYFLTQFRAMFTYMRLALFPVNQNLDYDYPVYTSILDWPVWVSLLSLLFLIYWTKKLSIKFRLVSFSIAWFFLTLTIPESSFWAMGDIISEHRLYLPLVGYSIFLVSAVYYLWGKYSIKTMVVVLTAIIAFNSVLTYQRNTVWKDEFTLWNDAVQKSPHKARPYINRGIYWIGQKNFPQAIADFTKAIARDPGFEEAYYDRGNAFFAEGDLSRAIVDYSKAIEIAPRYAQAYYNRSYIDELQGNLPQALSDCTKALEISPLYADAHLNLGNILTKQYHFIQAIAEYSRAIALNPAYAAAYGNRAVDQYELGNYDKAWTDVHTAQGLGGTINKDFLNALKKASPFRPGVST